MFAGRSETHGEVGRERKILKRRTLTLLGWWTIFEAGRFAVVILRERTMCNATSSRGLCGLMMA